MQQTISKFKAYFENLRGRKVAVIGIGVSNLPLLDLLIEYGAEVTAHDTKTAEQLGKTAEALQAKGVTLKVGTDYLTGLNCDVIFRSPGVYANTEALQEAKNRGVQVTSEMEAFFETTEAKIIGVTGSDGKTTTTTLISEMLKAAGYTVYLGGNIGTPLLNQCEKMQSTHIAVVELSSFQLQTLTKSPQIAVITNLTPNHLDVHANMEEYTEAKKNIYTHQNKDDLLVLNANCEALTPMRDEAKGRLASFGKDEIAGAFRTVTLKGGYIYCNGKSILDTKDIRIPGKHNIENYMTAIAAVFDLVKTEEIEQVAKNFAGVEHRVEFVRNVKGVSYYNDSIASSPTRTAAALHTFTQKGIFILGGKNKKVPFDDLAALCNEKAKAVILCGDTAREIEEAFKKIGATVPLHVLPKETTEREPSSFDAAVKKAAEIAVKGDIVILSPACTSFDMFENFAKRGNYFKELVSQMEKEPK